MMGYAATFVIIEDVTEVVAFPKGGSLLSMTPVRCRRACRGERRSPKYSRKVREGYGSTGLSR